MTGRGAGKRETANGKHEGCPSDEVENSLRVSEDERMMSERMRDSARAMVIFGMASLVAVASGCVAMAQSGIGTSSWLRSIVAWAAGAGLAALLARYGKARGASRGAVVLATGALIATLFAPAVQGAHRWVDVGPLHINVAALFLPALIVGLAAMGMARPIALLFACIAATVLVAQPDASQLTSFAIAASILLLRSSAATRWKVLGLAAAVVFAIAGWTRPDTLQPVAEVEQIFTMCLAVSPFLALLAGLALAAAAVAPLAFPSSAGDRARDGAIALSAYFLAVSIAPFFGWFPVPLVGLGMSFPVGFWLGMALLLPLQKEPEDRMRPVVQVRPGPDRPERSSTADVRCPEPAGRSASLPPRRVCNASISESLRVRTAEEGCASGMCQSDSSLHTTIPMNTKSLEPVLIKAIDGVARKLSQAERSAESNVARMLAYWNEMDPADKEQAVGIAIATISTAVAAIVALRGKSKKPLKSAGKKLVRAVAKKVG